MKEEVFVSSTQINIIYISFMYYDVVYILIRKMVVEPAIDQGVGRGRQKRCMPPPET